MTPATVCELWRYPIKSMRGEKLDGARIGECGVDGDRTHALRDQETGKIASAKLPRQWGVLLRCAARVTSVAGAVCISLAMGGRSRPGKMTLTRRCVR
jgi:uncharacterized protein YcbX